MWDLAPETAKIAKPTWTGDDIAVRIRGVTKHFGSGDRRVQALRGYRCLVQNGVEHRGGSVALER